MQTKKKFICVSPLTQEAKFVFYMEMNSFHSCEVVGEKVVDGVKHYQLQSLNKEFRFCIPTKGNQHWKIER